MSSLCEIHQRRAEVAAECPVCTTAQQVKDSAACIVELAKALQHGADFYGSDTASIALELHAAEIDIARALLKEIEG